MANIEILSIGNEILLGDVLDTNTQWLCLRLTGMGGHVRRACILRDEKPQIMEAVRAALSRHPELIITTGGLGPTADDMTLESVGEAIGRPVALDQQAQEMVRQRYQELAEQGYVPSAEMTPARAKMAHLPQGATPLSNRVGTAPGVLCRVGPTTIVCLPGVPGEMKGIFAGSLQEALGEVLPSAAYLAKQWMVATQDESILAPLLERVAKDHPKVYVKSRAKGFGPDAAFRVTLSAAGEEQGKVERLVRDAESDLGRALQEANIPVLSRESL